MRISDWSSDVCSSDLPCADHQWWRLLGNRDPGHDQTHDHGRERVAPAVRRDTVGTAFEGRHTGCKENRCQIPRRPGHTTLARAKAAGLTGRYPLHVQEAVEADRSESMNLKISGHHVDVTDPMREYVLTNLNRIERQNGT